MVRELRKKKIKLPLELQLSARYSSHSAGKHDEEVSVRGNSGILRSMALSLYNAYAVWHRETLNVVV
jgi:hypothetical protein